MASAATKTRATGAHKAHPKGSDGASLEIKQRGMSEDHKRALAAGREQSRAVKAYLTVLRDHKPKRGRKRTIDSINSRLAKIAKELREADVLQEVLLLQEQADLEKERDTMGGTATLSDVEPGFVAHAAAYCASKGIEYATLRKVGVSAEVLAKAGIPR